MIDEDFIASMNEASMALKWVAKVYCYHYEKKDMAGFPLWHIEAASSGFSKIFI